MAGRDDGFQTATIGGGWGASTEHIDSPASVARSSTRERRHQIPGLRQTPYLKVLFVRCDDNESYKSQTRSEIREWIKQNTVTAQSTRKHSAAENHDAFEWMIVHVVIPNSPAATQPRATKGPDGSTPDLSAKSSSRWGKSSSTLMEKLRSDFNGSSKTTFDRIAQIRIGINDVPYDMLPRVVPALPSGYVETEKDAENAWQDLIDKLKASILSSFDLRVLQYEEDIREKDSQRSLPGWNFCTFFILKEGLARGFESVGLVEDALVGYDELSVGLDTVIKEQGAADPAEARGGSLLNYTEDLRTAARRAVSLAATGSADADEDEETVDLQSTDRPLERIEDIPISFTKKPYRDMILANNVSIFDFRCYIFARQMALLLRRANAWSTREELLAKLREQQESVLRGVAPRAPPPKYTDEAENLSMLAEICKRTLEFIPAVSLVMRRDIVAGLAQGRNLPVSSPNQQDSTVLESPPLVSDVMDIVDDMVASYAFSVAQQILAQTSTKALPIPSSSFVSPDGHEQKASIPEPKTMMHPARSSSLHTRPGARPPPSPGIFPGPGRRASVPEADASTAARFLKVGLEELAARRAELYTLSRNILEQSGKKRGWPDGWASVPVIGEDGVEDMEDIDLDDDNQQRHPRESMSQDAGGTAQRHRSVAGFDNQLLRTALDNKDGFYRLYETLTEKALRHYIVAGHGHSVRSNKADLAVLKSHLGMYTEAAEFFEQTTPSFGESGWSLLELSMLVMYSRCLESLGKKDQYVRVVLKLLSTAAAAEKDKMEHQIRRLRHAAREKKMSFPDNSAIQGFLAALLKVSSALTSEVRVQLANFFCDVEVDGPPTYADLEDSFSVTLKLHSLLVDDLPIDTAKIRLVAHGSGAHTGDIWLTSGGSPLVLRPASNRIKLFSNDAIPGTYEIDRIRLASGNLVFQFDREPSSHPDSRSASILRRPRVTLYPRAGAFDVRLSAARHIQLDKDNSLDLEILSGWNDISNCDLRIRAATGGLRLLISEAQTIGSIQPLSRAAETGTVSLKAIPAGASVKIRFPFSVEQDVMSVSVRVEASYTTSKGTFTFCKAPSANVALALSVNVQDVFKHKALFSRFTVSTASTSPLRLFKSELLDSELFDSHFGVAPSNTLTIFPKQPASLLYKITRKPASKVGPKTQKKMYMRLSYSVLQDEIDLLMEKSILAALKGTPLHEYSRVMANHILHRVQTKLSAIDLERAALLQSLPTAFMSSIAWEKEFASFGKAEDGSLISTHMAQFMSDWLKAHPKLPLPMSSPETVEPCSILIPVDIPSITIVHTADIRLRHPIPAVSGAVNVNQLLPATLHLRWTRIWDTGGEAPGRPRRDAQELEFSFEVTAPTDAWLLGGRRKGHFVIPAPTPGSNEHLSSAPDTEAEIPLLLVPLREGWLPYPSVEIREVITGESEAEVNAHGHYQTDYRNLGETVKVIADRQRVTLSLDASGPGGGPLVLESEGRGLEDGVVV